MLKTPRNYFKNRVIAVNGRLEFKISNWTAPDSKICPRMISGWKGCYKSGYPTMGVRKIMDAFYTRLESEGKKMPKNAFHGVGLHLTLMTLSGSGDGLAAEKWPISSK